MIVQPRFLRTKDRHAIIIETIMPAIAITPAQKADDERVCKDMRNI
jgi:hypothetical protein